MGIHKVRIEEDEWHPVYQISDSNFGFEIQVDDETLNRWIKVEKDFWEVQKEMATMVRKFEEPNYTKTITLLSSIGESDSYGK